MFGNDRDSMRRYYVQAWTKFQQKQPMDALEQQVVAVIKEHPEYQRHLVHTDKMLERNYLPEQGETNPFLHMGLHLGIREQVATNRPTGISAVYQPLVLKYGAHAAEHRMMDCLAESMWLAQRYNTAPDEAAYLARLTQLLEA